MDTKFKLILQFEGKEFDYRQNKNFTFFKVIPIPIIRQSSLLYNRIIVNWGQT